jgi:hypothetical protein
MLDPMTSFLALVMLFVLFGVVPVVMAALFAAIAWSVRREWPVDIAGRRIVLRNRMFSEEVWIDGVRAPAAVSHWSMTSAVVSCTFEGKDGRRHQLTASIESDGGFGVVGHVFVDGRYVGGDPLEADAPAPAVPGASVPEPDDARWLATKQLVAGIATHGGQEAREAAGRVELAIRQALDDLAHLDEVKDAHRTVAQVAGDDAEQRLRAVLDLQEERVRVLLTTLSDLHLATLARTGTVGTDEAVGRARDVLGKLSADAEVDRAVKERAEKARMVAQKSRERSG